MEKVLKKITAKDVLITIFGILILIGTGFFILEKTRYLFVVDSDVLWHIKTGDWILSHGYVPKIDVFSWHEGLNWIPHEWLYDVFLSLIYGSMGLRGIMLLSLIILACRIGYVTIYNVVFKKESIWGFSIFTACMLILIGYTWAVGRPLELTMLIILTNLIVFIKKRKKLVYYITLGVSGIIMANVHGGAIWIIFAPIAISMIVDFVYLWKTRNTEEAKEHKELAISKLIAIGIGILASLINPRGLEVYNYFIKMIFTGANEATNSIGEWQPINFISAIAGFFFLVVFVSFAFNKKTYKLDKETLTKILIISFWGVGMLRYCRMTPIFLFTVLLWGYEFVREFVMYMVESFKLQKIFTIAKVVSIIGGIIFIILTMVMGIKWFNYYFKHDEKELMKDGFPYASIQYLKDHNVKTKIYNDDWGSWMLWNDIPTFMDGRCDPFVEEFSPGNNQFVEAANVETLDDYLEIFKKYDIEYIFIKSDKDKKILFESTGNWETVVFEQRAMLLKRKDVQD